MHHNKSLTEDYEKKKVALVPFSLKTSPYHTALSERFKFDPPKKKAFMYATPC